MQPRRETVTDLRGNAIAGAQITVRTLAGALAAIFDPVTLAALPNPTQTDETGTEDWTAANGVYDVTTIAQGKTKTERVELSDPADVSLTLKSTDSTATIQAAVTAAISGGVPLVLSPGNHAAITIPTDIATAEAAMQVMRSWRVPPGASLSIHSTGYSLASVSGFAHPDRDRIRFIDTSQAAGSDTVYADVGADFEFIRNGLTVSEPVNVPQSPAAGTSATVTLAKIKHRFSIAERVGYFAATGESIDSFSLPSGIYKLAGTEAGNFPIVTIAQKVGLLIVPGAEESKAQWFISNTGGCWRRFSTLSAGAPVWGAWLAWTQAPIDNTDGSITGNFDWNTLTEPGWYRRNSAGAGTSNGPTTNFGGLIEVIANHDRSFILQRAHQVPATTTMYIRSFSASAWTAWHTYTGT